MREQGPVGLLAASDGEVKRILPPRNCNPPAGLLPPQFSQNGIDEWFCRWLRRRKQHLKHSSEHRLVSRITGRGGDLAKSRLVNLCACMVEFHYAHPTAGRILAPHLFWTTRILRRQGRIPDSGDR